MKHGIFFLACSVLNLVSFSQTKITPAYAATSVTNNNTLLWRISGNGLTQSSYLFGTIHLKDKRLFNFDDSVYHSIEKCEGMAMEVNPDEMIAFHLNKTLDEEQNRNKLKDVLNKEDYKKYEKRLADKFKKPASEVSAADILKEKSKWTTEMFEKGEMQTFVDAYLYGLARKQGKWVGGIEDIADQSGLLDNIDNSDIEYLLAPDNKSDGTNKVLEEMIKLYLKQDLDGIHQFMQNRLSGETNDKLLTRRNVKMARRMDSLSAIRTMFFAVGAAHLHGDSGVIALLKSRGFTVQPVFSKNKIRSEKYKVKAVDIPWIDVKEEKGLYTVSMPGNPASVKVSGLLHMKFLVDISNFTGHYTTAAGIPGKISNKDSVMDKVAFNIFGKRLKSSPKYITMNGAKGKEFLQEKDNTYIRLQLFIENNVLYMAGMFAMKKENLLTPSADKFFRSFTIHKPSLETNTAQYFTDSVMGVRLLTPANLTYAKQFSDTQNETWKISAYTGSDVSTGVYVMLFSKEVRPGYRIITDSLIYEEQYERMKSVHAYFNQSTVINESGKKVEYWGQNKENPNMYTRGVNTVKDNRNVLLLVLGDSLTLKSDAVNGIFNSMQFISKPVKWSQQKNIHKGVTAWMPASFRQPSASDDNTNLVYSFDTTTATSYIIAVDTFSRYTQYSSDSAFWKTVIDENTQGSELVSVKPAKSGRLVGKEIFFRHLTAYNNYTRMSIFVSDSIVFRIMASASKELLYSNDVNKMFATFRVTKEGSSSFTTASKTKLILKDLADQSSDIRYQAYNAIDDAIFVKEELPQLHEALFNNYLSPYDSLASTLINRTLAEKIATLHPSATIKYVREKFNALTGTISGMQFIALATLGNIKTTESYQTLASLISKYDAKEKFPAFYAGVLKDSLALTKLLVPQMLAKAGDTSLAPAFSGVLVTLMDSALVEEGTVREKAQAFNAMATNIIALTKAGSASYNQELYGVVRLLARLNTTETVNTLLSALQIDNKYLKHEVIMLLTKRNHAVPREVMEELASDKEMRIQLYSELKEANKLNLFPKKYLTQALFAESMMYAASSDDMEPLKIEFLKSIDSKYENKKYNFYLYRVTYEDDETAYLGIAGGFGNDKKKLETEIDLSGVYAEPLDTSSLSNQLKAYLAGLEESATEE